MADEGNSLETIEAPVDKVEVRPVSASSNRKLLPAPPSDAGSMARTLVPKFSRASSKLKGTALARSRVTVETSKEKTREPKDVKAGALSRLDARHKFVLARAADLMAVDAAAVEQSVCLDSTQIDRLDHFFAKDGSLCILFWQQVGASGSQQRKPTVCLSSGSLPDEAVVTGTCVFATRASARAITAASLGLDINFGAVAVKQHDRSALLAALNDLMFSIILPYMEGNENWGKLPRQQTETKAQFLDTLARFQTSLSEATLAVRDSVLLQPPPPDLDLSSFRGPKDFARAAEDPAVVGKLEKLLTTWHQQIERVIAQSEQMRKEADNVGPRAELQHWKYRMAKFNGLLDQIKDNECTIVVNILQLAKLRHLLEQWRALDARITEEANEAKDNVKYLYTMEKFCLPLYKANPPDMLEAIPGLLNAVSMIHSVSRYYNTSDRMTALLVKITNQMINASHGYIYEHEPRVWEIPSAQLFPKFDQVQKLNQQYQNSFYKEKTKLAQNPQGCQFDFSEMSIFGKFDAFCRRMDKVRAVFGIIEDWNRLQHSKIEKLEPINVQFRTLVANLKKKSYDPLNTRKPDFDADYEAFLQDIGDLLQLLQTFMDTHFSSIPSVLRALQQLSNFEKIKHVGLELDTKYELVFNHYGLELEELKTIYQRDRNDPPIARNLPPMAGRIAWARQLFSRIEGPMTVFQSVASHLLTTAAGKKTVKSYNKMGHVLMEFEMVYHRAWWRAVDQAQTGLQASLLVRHPDTDAILINLDPQLLQLVRETAMMEKLKLEIPESAVMLGLQAHRLKQHDSQLRLLATEYSRVMAQIDPILESLLAPARNKVDTALAPGFTQLSWMSVNLDAFLETVYRELGAFELHLKKATDILSVRIEGAMVAIAQTRLCVLSDAGACDISQFAASVAATCEAETKNIQRHSDLARVAVDELLAMIHGKIPATGLSDRLEADFGQALQVFQQRNTEALVKCIKGSLNDIKRRLTTRSQGYAEAPSDGTKPPVFRARVNLNIPNITMTPQLDDIQQAVNKACQQILQVTKDIPRWKNQGQHFAAVSENKDIIKTMSMLSSAINVTKQDVQDTLDRLTKFNNLWQDDREAKIKDFMDTEPDLSDFEFTVRQYDVIETAIENIPNILRVGSLELNTEPFKQEMTAETRAWKQLYGHNLNKRAKTDMEAVHSFCDDITKRLSKKVEDLEDVRGVMATLKELRENEIRLDGLMNPVEQSYAMLSKYEVAVQKAETERLDALQYAWSTMRAKALEVQDHLTQIQPRFKEDLLVAVKHFQAEEKALVSDYNIKGPMQESIAPQEASDRLTVFNMRFEDLWRRYVTYSGGEELFGMEQAEYPELQRIKKELGLLQKLYSLYNDVIKGVNGYYDIPWVEVDIERINSELIEYGNRCRKLPKALKDWEAFLELKKTIDDFNECCPLLEAMASPAMLPRHWTRLEEVTKTKLDVQAEGFLLRNIMEAPLLVNKEDIEDTCIAAVKEKDIESKLKQLIAEWSGRDLSFMPFKTRGELLLNGGETSELMVLMEDSLMILSSLMSNRYNAPFKPEIQIWVKHLSDSSEIVERWLVVQNLWVYLEAVFVGGDIAKQLPQEAKRFGNIDKSWAKIMTRAHEIPNMVQCCTGDETMGSMLPHLLEQLEVCQKSLVGYLEKKRLIFPRFFFVSDSALLEILGQASDSHTIQAHLLNIFDNIKSVTFHEKTYDQILSYASKEGETVVLQKPVMAQGNVEVWLGTLLAEQRTSLHAVICDAAVASLGDNLNLIELQNSFPSQVGILGIQFIWTRDAEVALANARADKKIMAQMDEKFLNMLSVLIDATLSDLSKVDRTKFETLVTLHVHQRDIFHDLVLMHVRTLTDFEWTKQARFYYLEEERRINIQITDVSFNYCNEFIGCVERLCVTPLTDRCYITLAQALGMSMGGAPAGPAGTGKTETVKDMGRALGKYVVVFNCSDQMDFRGLGRIYKGLAQSGSWGCFDEFNRIELPVLSVAAQQIAIVLTAKKERKPNFIFMDGDDVTLDPEFGLFLTMNPGYAGRQELPENLKIQFRTVAMMVPDRQIIIRVKLASCGFQNNVILARKFYTLYKLCEEQLTKQVHYDFGLRNILSVLRTLGEAKRQNPDDGEMKIVMRVLRDMNLSKLVDEDEPLFLSLISDLFPGIELETAGYPELEAAINKHVLEAGLVNHPPWTLKLIQLFETQRVRHGFMVLGPSGTGKTCNISVLLKAMTETGTPHREMRMNPKAITAPQMFGRLDVATNDWTDGIFNVLWRRTLKGKKGEKIWIVLDGPVDAVWIENLNSVLDDNKMLTLANGDRIPMSPDAKLVFEPHNVDNASPATVSRNGMVFMSPSALGWQPILESWLKTRASSEAETLRTCFQDSFEDLLSYSLFTLDNKMKLLECNYIKQACDLLSGLIPVVEGKTCSAKHLARLYVFVLMWSLGAVLELADRAKLQEKMTSVREPSLDLPRLNGSEDSIFDYLVGEDGEWLHWSNRVEPYIYPKDEVPPYNNILVPNVDNVRTDYLIDSLAKQRKAVLLIGEQGTAKTVIVKGYCRRYNPEVQTFKTFNFSSTSTPNGFQRTIESYIEKRMGSTYGPPGGKKLTVFIDDINMPVINEWRDQIANEIVRQVMSVDGFYSLDKPGDFVTLTDMQWIAAMPHPGGGRNDIPERLKRQFSVFNCTLPSNQSIDLIFRTIGEGYFCAERGFTADVVETVKKLVPTTRKVWQDTKGKMLPTPAKFHYVFNMRDVSRIWQGMLLVKASECPDVSTVLSLWKHECFRVIADRFTNHKDIEWFDARIHSNLASDLGAAVESQLVKEPYFVDFLRDAPEPTGEEQDDADLEAPKIYERVPSLEVLSSKLADYLSSYNETVRGSKMDLVFFKDCILHLVKVSRIIRIPQGNALLVGVGGSGKQSVTRLASAIARYTVFQIQLSRSYNASNLMEDLKSLYNLAGVKGKGVTFIMTDNEIKSEDFLEYINNVLATGEVGGLFARDELDEICTELTPVMKKELPKVAPTNDALYEFFISRVRSNLHVVLCFSPVGEKFRSRALKFPAVFSGCTMDWFMSWPKDALIAVADHFLGNFTMSCTPTVKQSVVQTMGVVQDGVNQSCQDYFQRYRRQTFVTPASYLSFLNSYRKLYDEKRKFIDELSRRMNTGLDKLVEASKSVEQLSIELVEKEKELVVASAETEKVLKEVTVSAAAAEKVKAAVQKVKDKAQAIVDSIAKDKAVAEAKLAAAAPALASAEAALQTIKPSDIATVKKLGKPPHLIMRIMDCVLLLFNLPVDPVILDPERPSPTPTWREALKTMSGPFLQQLMSFNKDLINGETCELMEPYLTMEDYNLESAKRVCGNVAGLCSWTEAMAFFFTINKEVLPLKAGLAVAEGKLVVAQRDLDTAQLELDAKQAELDIVQARFDETMRKKQALQEDAETCKRKMSSASALINGLGGEKERWTQQSKEFAVQTQRLVGDVLIMCAFMSYSGPFNAEFRTVLIQKWRTNLTTLDIPFSKDLNVVAQLVDNATAGEWGLQGLPNDELSLQNGIIVTKATRFPLLIDPQGQAKNWIRNREANNELTVTSLDHKYFRQHLEDALSLGRPLLLEDVGEELDPCLDSVLEKNFIKSGSTFKVKVGDKEVDVMNGFRIYLTTKLANPKYTPEIFARTSIIDFTVTMKGLEDQLLARVILTEKAELETERVALMTEVTANKKKMKELEDNLLYRLTTTQGSLVDDESLISVLQVTKTTAEEVNEKLAIAADTEIKINTAREEYRPVATRGSILYFLIVEMSLVNSMYQTALDQFLGIFNQSMEESTKSPVPTKRINNIIEFLTFAAFKYTARGLYETHKFLFTLLLALKIDLDRAKIKHIEFNTLIKGGAALDLNAVQPKPKPWIVDSTWLNLVQLSSLPRFSEICSQIARNDKGWKAWFDTAEPESEPLPDGYEKLDVLGRLLLIRSWCPDRVIAQARKYIASSIGQRYAESVILDLEQMRHESTSRTPLVCLLSMGSDPTASIQHLAKQHKLECRDVSMGQGQEMQAFQQTGGWVLLQNCHLALGFLAELQSMVEATENVHDNFRLWITTEVHPNFPINFLQISIKFTNEPPQGLKAGLKRTYANVTQDQLDVVNVSHWRPMMFSVAFLHSIVQERRKFGPLGWNIPYEFNEGDLIASTQAVQNHLDDLGKGTIMWSAVRYYLSEVHWGGRVTDDRDKRLLITYCNVWFGDHMFGDAFEFYKGYKVIVKGKIEEYRAAIEEMPLVDTPEVFGLHPNADISYQTAMASETLGTILDIQPKDSSGSGGESREDTVTRMCNEFLEKLPANFLVHEVKARLKKMGAFTSLNIFLRQEIDRMQRVLGLVRQTLTDLILAIDGTIIMSELLRDALDNMYDARVPTSWLDVSWPSGTLGFWFTELLERHAQFHSWCFTGRPKAFWMTGFFNPTGFITAMRQEITRAHKGWALDSVVVANKVTKFASKDDIQTPPAEGVYIYGLYLDGAGWDKKNLVLCDPSPKVLFTPLPVLHLYAINSTGERDKRQYQCPIYKKPRRTDLEFVSFVDLPSNADPQKWILRGVALLSDTK